MCEGDVQLHLRYQQNAKHITRLSRIHTSRDRIACDHKQLAFVQNLVRGRALLSLSALKATLLKTYALLRTV
jgi:hypothetical protein